MMTETVRNAYRIVYNDMLNSGCGLLVGEFDAHNGTEDFMYGVQMVMEWIADKVDADGATYADFNDLFTNNFLKSVDKARHL